MAKLMDYKVYGEVFVPIAGRRIKQFLGIVQAGTMDSAKNKGRAQLCTDKRITITVERQTNLTEPQQRGSKGLDLFNQETTNA